MKYLHTMVRVRDLDASLRFYRDALGLEVLKQREYPQGRFTLVYLAAPGDRDAQVGGADDTAPGQDHSALDRIFQLADVPGPRVTQDRIDCLRAEL